MKHRYPEDVKDRIWEPTFDSEWKQIWTTLKPNNSNGYLVPKNVLMTAAIPANDSAPFRFTEELDSPTDELYVYLHFSEVQSLQANESREFDILWSGEVAYEAFIPEYLNITTIQTNTPVTCPGGKCNLELKRTKNSTHPPLINAIEFYTVVNFPQLETNETDGTLVTNARFIYIKISLMLNLTYLLLCFMTVVAIKDIKATYELNRITWQGDPCVPQKFIWEGLDCNSKDALTLPRITSL